MTPAPNPRAGCRPPQPPASQADGVDSPGRIARAVATTITITRPISTSIHGDTIVLPDSGRRHERAASRDRPPTALDLLLLEEASTTNRPTRRPDRGLRKVGHARPEERRGGKE